MAVALPTQRSFEAMGTPLCEVTFVVVDLETTGGSAACNAITEIGAVKLRGGVCLGTFQTLVNPGTAIPPAIVYLTGITDRMVGPAPSIEPVMASFLEFLGGSVVVGHNVRFDLSFIDAVLARQGLPRIANPVVDTCALARRLVREEVPNCRLGTLAAHLRLSHRPSHRALEDALATGDLLHYLLERAGALGVLGLEDLLEMPRMTGHPQAAKLKMTTSLPRRPGVYLFRDGAGHIIYVGKAADLRQRVRSYFSTDERRKVGGLLRQAASVDHIVCANGLEAAAIEARLIGHLEPRFNRRGTGWRRYKYVKLTLTERFPRLAVVRAAKGDDGCLYLGPFASSRGAQMVVEAIETGTELRRCRGPIRTQPTAHRCPTRALGLRRCPCDGGMSESDYGRVVDTAVRALTVEPELIFDALGARMHMLAAEARFEEAAELRDRAAALARALVRQRRLDAVRAAGRITLLLPDGGGATLVEGRLASAWGPVGPALPATLPTTASPAALAGAHGPSADVVSIQDPGAWPAPLACDQADEVVAVAAWLEANADRVLLIEATHGLAMTAPQPPSFVPLEPAMRNVGEQSGRR